MGSGQEIREGVGGYIVEPHPADRGAGRLVVVDKDGNRAALTLCNHGIGALIQDLTALHKSLHCDGYRHGGAETIVEAVEFEPRG